MRLTLLLLAILLLASPAAAKDPVNRVIGHSHTIAAARICGVDEARLLVAIRLVMHRLDATASDTEFYEGLDAFVIARDKGADDARAGRYDCATVIKAFGNLERFYASGP